MKSESVAKRLGRRPRKWTLREDNHAHHHGVVDLDESPLELQLSWRKTSDDPVRYVGSFRLDLEQLLSGGFVRDERTRSDGRKIRLRVVKEPDGNFFVQVSNGQPKFLLRND